ncbi:MAG TPA: MFS transporter, partial [Solirubrobacteraceae bacterium]
GWGSTQIVAQLAGAALLLVAFIAIERRQERPMLDLGLFRKPTFAGASIVAFSLSGSMFAMFLYLTLYIQNILGYSPLQAGLRFLPLTLLSFVAAPISGRLSTRLPIRGFFVVGLAMVGAALLLMGGLSADSTWTALLAGFCLAGVGVGLINPALASTAVGVVPPSRSGMGSGINNTFRQVGIATGIAGLGAVFQHQVQSKALALLAGTPPGASGNANRLAHMLGGNQAREAIASVPGPQRGLVAGIARESFISGINELFVITAALAFLGAVLAFVLVRQRDFVAGAAHVAAAD